MASRPSLCFQAGIRLLTSRNSQPTPAHAPLKFYCHHLLGDTSASRKQTNVKCLLPQVRGTSWRPAQRAVDGTGPRRWCHWVLTAFGGPERAGVSVRALHGSSASHRLRLRRPPHRPGQADCFGRLLLPCSPHRGGQPFSLFLCDVSLCLISYCRVHDTQRI